MNYVSKEERESLRYIAMFLVGNYLNDLVAREPPDTYETRQEWNEWSSIKYAVTEMYNRIENGFNPVMVVEDYANQSDYFAFLASESGNYDTSSLFSLNSDVALDLLEIFIQNGLLKEDFVDEQD